MHIKSTIKNDLWRVNYIVPFVKKHQFDERGRAGVLYHVLRTYASMHPVAGGKTVGGNTKNLLSSVSIDLDGTSRFIYFIDTAKTLAVAGNILSNFPLDYAKVLDKPFRKMAEEAVGGDAYGQEARLAAEGVYNLAQRIVDAIWRSDYGEEDKERLAGYFTRMLDTPAGHFEEALQRILFFNQIMWQTRHRLNGLGRLDKILHNLYGKDIAAGVLTKGSARVLVSDFLRQLSRYPEYKSDALEGDIGQIIILGGLDPDGTYFHNDLTMIFMEEQAKLKKPDPKILLRVCDKTPDEVLSAAVGCLAHQTGSPLFSNDDRVIPALLDAGIGNADAYGYCTSACWEPFIVGKSLDQNNIGVFDFFPALQACMEQEYATFDALLEKYKEQNAQRFGEFLDGLNRMKLAKDPLVSMFTEGCSAKRRDIATGSCTYKDYGITTVALPNVVDSLLQVKRMVFDEKKYTLKQLNAIRKHNFEAGESEEALYRELAASRKAYGHDDAAVIRLVNDITGGLSEVAANWRNVYGGTVKFGLSSPAYNMLGKKTAADMAGRKNGMPYSTHISCPDAPYTEVVNFAGRLDYTGQRYNGNVVDFFVTPELLKGENGHKFFAFLKGAIRAGFFQMQMNVMDSATLIDAKKHPEEYAGLMVRVWGFSAYFNELPKSYQDLLIERALSAEKLQ